ncbi:alpha/beta hydrolase family esterase [Amycolatopsis taiwanensis]|uniref:alpha/beta hydrolase family esterase n=1 Tax=Amycolatopsis taiwanensis TaxID=342230 RepID=UPI0004863E12|nr:PHB depolymerase family esterase [Amycolatopsis taiwanensis]
MERTVTLGGMPRTYLAIGPSHDAGLPLLVVLHGREVTASQESKRTGFLTYAQRGMADLVYPQGTANSWNDGHGCCGKASATGVDDLGFVAKVVADASQFFHSDPKRVYLVGYSNGGRLAFEEVCGHPALFAAFATYGALPPTECPGGPPVRVFIGAGANDSIMHSEGSVTNAVAWWRSRDGCGPDATTTHAGPLTMTTWTRCRGGSAVASALYAGIGHPWPVAKPSQAPFTVSVGAGAAAATVMWNFFTAHAA